MEPNLAISASRVHQLWYAPLLAIAMALMLLRLVLVARLLDLDAFAQFSGGLLISSTFGMLACLGLQLMLQRDMPVQILRRRERAAFVTLAQCLIVTVGCGMAVLLLTPLGVSVGTVNGVGVAIGVVHGLSQQVFLLATVESRSRGEPLRFALQNLTRSVAVLGMGVTTALLTDSALGTLFAEAATSLWLAQSLLRAQLRRSFPSGRLIFRLAARRLPRVKWSSAAALLVVTAVGFLALNVDRWVAAVLLASSDFAAYSFVWVILMVAQATQVLVSTSVYPSLARRLVTHSQREVFATTVRVSGGLLAVGLIAAVPAWFGLDAALRAWFPAYASAGAVLPVFLLIAALRVSNFWASFLILTGKEVQLVWLNIGGTVAAVLSWLVWTQPWRNPSLSIMEIALLAALLTVVSYTLTAFAAWCWGADGSDRQGPPRGPDPRLGRPSPNGACRIATDVEPQGKRPAVLKADACCLTPTVGRADHGDATACRHLADQLVTCVFTEPPRGNRRIKPPNLAAREA